MRYCRPHQSAYLLGQVQQYTGSHIPAIDVCLLHRRFMPPHFISLSGHIFSQSRRLLLIKIQMQLKTRYTRRLWNEQQEKERIIKIPENTRHYWFNIMRRRCYLRIFTEHANVCVFSANEYRCPLYSVHSFCHLFLCRLLLQAGSVIQRTTIACKNTLASWFHNISHGSYRPTCYRALR